MRPARPSAASAPHRRLRAAALISAAVLLGLPGCAQFPRLDAAISDAARAAPYPDLLPIGHLRAATATPDPGSAAGPAGELAARVAALRARAARLRGPVIPPQERARMQRGIPGA